MILVDTSAWVEFLRATGSPVHTLLRRHLEANAELHTTDMVVMEVLAGARDTAHAAKLRQLLMHCTFVPTQGLADFEHSADLYRSCRAGGETIRALADCFIAAVAIRCNLELLHADRDFDALARHTALRLHPAR
jgi:hypothetical protein